MRPAPSAVIRIGSLLWSTASQVRRWGTRKKIFKSITLDSRVMSVGNIQAGGAGKTPLVAKIAAEATERGIKTCILTRGYRGKWENQGGIIAPGEPFVNPEISGDEASLLHELCPHAWVGVGRNRVKQYQNIRKKSGRTPDLVILDDGLQNHQIYKNTEIVALTSATRDRVLFRDSATVLENAHLLVWTKGEIPLEYQGMKTRKPWAQIRYRLESPPQSDCSLWLITGIADGHSAYRLAMDSGYRIEKFTQFQDHFKYLPDLIQKVLSEAQALKFQVAITGKDWVKWKQLGVERKQVTVLEPEIEWVEGREAWERVVWEQSSF